MDIQKMFYARKFYVRQPPYNDRGAGAERAKRSAGPTAPIVVG